MKITRKEFKIVQLVNNENDFIITEVFYIFCIKLYHCFYSVDGLNGDIPFELFSSAKNKLEELEQLEECESKFRNGTFVLTFTVLVVVSLILSQLL